MRYAKDATPTAGDPAQARTGVQHFEVGEEEAGQRLHTPSAHRQRKREQRVAGARQRIAARGDHDELARVGASTGSSAKARFG